MNNKHVFIEKLRSSGLRPTKQRIEICKLLFDRKDTFHFSISDLKNNLENLSNKKISLATIYNTIHAFREKGYLKEISINSDKTYFDTNTSDHHHFFDESKKKYVASQQGWKCAMCSNILDATYEVDHKLDLQYGGSNHVSNLAALCPNCHRRKTLENNM